jgi:Acetyltransferase (GNAT) domain
MNEAVTSVKRIMPVDSTQRAAHEAALLSAGIPLSSAQRMCGDLILGDSTRRVTLSALDGERCVGLLTAEIHPSRRLRGSTVVVARRVSAMLDANVLRDLVQESSRLASEQLGARRIIVSVWGADGPELSRARDVLCGLGFAPRVPSSCPRRTVILDLRDGEDGLLKRVRPSLRRRLRELARLPVSCAPITNERLGDRMRQIKEESYARHGALAPILPVPGFIAAAREHPETFSLVGLYRDDRHDVDGLMAWEFGTCDGHTGVTEHAGMSTIRLDGRAVPGGYATLWATIRWAIDAGAMEFDLGGISLPDDPEYAATGSISQFKLHFGGEIVPGREVEFERVPDTLSARFFSAIERAGARR